MLSKAQKKCRVWVLDSEDGCVEDGVAYVDKAKALAKAREMTKDIRDCSDVGEENPDGSVEFWNHKIPRRYAFVTPLEIQGQLPDSIPFVDDLAAVREELFVERHKNQRLRLGSAALRRAVNALLNEDVSSVCREEAQRVLSEFGAGL